MAANRGEKLLRDFANPALAAACRCVADGCPRRPNSHTPLPAIARSVSFRTAGINDQQPESQLWECISLECSLSKVFASCLKKRPLGVEDSSLSRSDDRCRYPPVSPIRG